MKNCKCQVFTYQRTYLIFVVNNEVCLNFLIFHYRRIKTIINLCLAHTMPSQILRPLLLWFTHNTVCKIYIDCFAHKSNVLMRIPRIILEWVFHNQNLVMITYLWGNIIFVKLLFWNKKGAANRNFWQLSHCTSVIYGLSAWSHSNP